MKVTIKQEGSFKTVSELLLDDEPVKLDGLKKIEVDMTAGERSQLKLTYLPSEVEIELINSKVIAPDKILYDSLESR